MFRKINEIIDKAVAKGKKRIAIAVAEDNYVIGAIKHAKELGVISPIFVGNLPEIKKLAKNEGLVINESEIIDIPDMEKACIKAIELVSSGNADILMKGLIPTNIFLKHILNKEYNLLSGKLLSHFALFESPFYHKLFGLSDAAMNISPTLEEKAAILKNSVDIFHLLGFEKPKVAILAAIEKINSKMIATTDAVELKKMADRGVFGNCFVDGPLALDNAVSPEAAKHKGITSKVAGDADILIAPDIQAGNILYKSLSFLGNAHCGAIIAGSRVPIVLTSRADSEETKFLSILLGVLCSN